MFWGSAIQRRPSSSSTYYGWNHHRIFNSENYCWVGHFCCDRGDWYDRFCCDWDGHFCGDWNGRFCGYWDDN
jgi:hypothetical protein